MKIKPDANDRLRRDGEEGLREGFNNRKKYESNGGGGTESANEKNGGSHKKSADEGGQKEQKEQKEQEKQTDALVRLAQQKSEALFHASDGETWADIGVHGHRETWAIRSRNFRRWLLQLYRESTGTVPGGDAVSRAIDALDAIAAFDGEEQEVFVRIAGDGNKVIFIDLCDANWRAIEITAEGYRVIERPPVRFRRARGMLPLPEPQKGGDIGLLRKYLNVASDDDFALVVACLVGALRPQGPYAVLGINGEHGTAKTSFARVVRELIDPSILPPRRPPSDARDLFVSATTSYVLSYDNLSDIPRWLSDALCSLSTGGAYATRKLWTDDEEQLFKAKRPVIINGITNVIVMPDLADRAVFVTLAVIPEDKRKRESVLWAEFAQDQPKILGVLLDAVVHGLKTLPTIQPSRLPRMADFAHWAMACEGAFFKVGTFGRAYAANQKGGVENAIDADPVASAVCALVADQPLVEDKREWHGTTKRLREELGLAVGEAVAKSRRWPQSDRGLTDRLETAATFLRRVHISIKWSPRTNRGREITITLETTPGTHTRHTRHSQTQSSQGVGGDGHPEETYTPSQRPSPGQGDPHDILADSHSPTHCKIKESVCRVRRDGLPGVVGQMDPEGSDPEDDEPSEEGHVPDAGSDDPGPEPSSAYSPETTAAVKMMRAQGVSYGRIREQLPPTTRPGVVPPDDLSIPFFLQRKPPPPQPLCHCGAPAPFGLPNGTHVCREHRHNHPKQEQ